MTFWVVFFFWKKNLARWATFFLTQWMNDISFFKHRIVKIHRFLTVSKYRSRPDEELWKFTNKSTHGGFLLLLMEPSGASLATRFAMNWHSNFYSVKPLPSRRRNSLVSYNRVVRKVYLSNGTRLFRRLFLAFFHCWSHCLPNAVHLIIARSLTNAGLDNNSQLFVIIFRRIIFKIVRYWKIENSWNANSWRKKTTCRFHFLGNVNFVSHFHFWHVVFNEKTLFHF